MVKFKKSAEHSRTIIKYMSMEELRSKIIEEKDMI